MDDRLKAVEGPVSSPPVDRVSGGMARRIYQTWERYRAVQEVWAKIAAEDEDFYHGKQWTRKQIDELERRGMAPLVINRVMPVIQQEVSIFTATRPTYKGLARDDTDVKVAHVVSETMSYVWYHSDGDEQWTGSAQDMFITGAGYMHAFVNPIKDDGRGEVEFESLPIYDVYPDPYARRSDLSDARAIILSRRVSTSSLLMMYPHKRSLILSSDTEEGPNTDRPEVNPSTNYNRALTGLDMDVGDDSDPMRRLIICYEKMITPKVRITNLVNGVTFVMDEGKFSPNMINGTQFTYEYFYRHAVRATTTIGENTILNQVTLPLSVYPVIPLFLYHQRNPFPAGDVAAIKGQQQEINKRRSVMIHNATLAGNYRMVAERGSISPAMENEWYTEGTNPGFILYYNKGYSPPEPMLPQALPTAWVQLEETAKQDLEYTVSVFAHQMGSSINAPETYRALLALEEAGKRKLMHKLRSALTGMKTLGTAVMELSQALYTRPKLMRIVGEDNGEVRELFLNKPSYDVLTGELKSLNSLSQMRFDVMIQAGTSMPTNRMAALNMYMEMFSMGLIDQEEVLKKADIVDREGVLERISAINQLRSQVAQQETAYNQLTGLNQTLRRQLQQSEVWLGVEKGRDQVKDEIQQTQNEQKLARARIKDAVSLTAQKLALLERESKLTANEKVARIELQMLKEQADAQISNARRKNDGTG